MTDPNEKDKNRQGSSGRPGTKFMERPGSESDAGKDEGQFGTESQYGEGQQEGQTYGEGQGQAGGEKFGQEKQDPTKKKDWSQGGQGGQQGGQKKQGGQGGSEQSMGKEE